MKSIHLFQLEAAINNARAKLLNHRIYESVTNIHQLQRFMEGHCYAVWDFMSLTKRLQAELTCMSLPWVPCENPDAARFITEIAMGEECDENPSGGNISHLTLYQNVMDEIGADTSALNRVISNARSGKDITQLFSGARVPEEVQRFTLYNLKLAVDGTLPEVLAAFVFGREDLIPEMFQQLVDRAVVQEAPTFRYYLKRHIELDGDEHGPLAMRLLESVCGTDGEKWHRAETAALRAIRERIKLWDAILYTLEGHSGYHLETSEKTHIYRHLLNSPRRKSG